MQALYKLTEQSHTGSTGAQSVCVSCLARQISLSAPSPPMLHPSARTPAPHMPPYPTCTALPHAPTLYVCPHTMCVPPCLVGSAQRPQWSLCFPELRPRAAGWLCLGPQPCSQGVVDHSVQLQRSAEREECGLGECGVDRVWTWQPRDSTLELSTTPWVALREKVSPKAL